VRHAPRDLAVVAERRWARRSELELWDDQVRAITAYHRADQAGAQAVLVVGQSREMRLDVRRRRDARMREQRALMARADEHLSRSGNLLAGHVQARAVIGHRNAWLRERVAARLEALGVAVVGMFDDGADLAGTLVVEQPELVLVEDLLPTVTGIEVVRRAALYAPQTLVGAQTMDGEGVPRLLEAGASVVVTRRIPPDDIADQMVSALDTIEGPLVLA